MYQKVIKAAKRINRLKRMLNDFRLVAVSATALVTKQQKLMAELTGAQISEDQTEALEGPALEASSPEDDEEVQRLVEEILDDVPIAWLYDMP